MDYTKTGTLIRTLRNEKGMTQKQLADLMHLSDKTISKWERGLGCPDISLIRQLAHILAVDTETILRGHLNYNDIDGGNMKRVKFYVCSDCGNTSIITGDADISCCGRKLLALTAQKADEAHQLIIEDVDDECYVTFSHEMTKEHYITFVAYVTYDRVLLIKLYPEQNSELRFPKMRNGKLYFHCSKHGLRVKQ